jgi:hypothetical protein
MLGGNESFKEERLMSNPELEQLGKLIASDHDLQKAELSAHDLVQLHDVRTRVDNQLSKMNLNLNSPTIK